MGQYYQSEYGIYLHMPWCASRCPYCAFYKEVDPSPNFSRWVEGIQRDFEHWRSKFPGRVHSIYFGGGTPSLAPVEIISSVLNTIPRDAETEITVETNPGTIGPQKLRQLCDIGINRLSLGIQTTIPHHARPLGRGHTVRQARDLLVSMAGLPLRSWSADLIFALPNQTLAELEHDIEVLLAAEAPHVSLYGLTIEEGTAFAEHAAKGLLVLPDDEQWARLYTYIQKTLTEAGLLQYEVSNFARPGHRSRHNHAIWRGGHYMGLGPSAHGFAPNGVRWVNPADINKWWSAPPPSGETVTPHEAAIDYLLSSVRHTDGCDLKYLSHSTGMRPHRHTIEQLIAAGLITHENHHLKLTATSFSLADGVTRKLCNSLERIPTKNDLDPIVSA